MVSGSARFKKRTRTLNPRLSNLFPYSLMCAQPTAKRFAFTFSLDNCFLGCLIDFSSEFCSFITACAMGGSFQDLIFFVSDLADLLILSLGVGQAMTATIHTTCETKTHLDHNNPPSKWRAPPVKAMSVVWADWRPVEHTTGTKRMAFDHSAQTVPVYHIWG